MLNVHMTRASHSVQAADSLPLYTCVCERTATGLTSVQTLKSSITLFDSTPPAAAAQEQPPSMQTAALSLRCPSCYLMTLSTGNMDSKVSFLMNTWDLERQMTEHIYLQ